jgi:hypothetical protein
MSHNERPWMPGDGPYDDNEGWPTDPMPESEPKNFIATVEGYDLFWLPSNGMLMVITYVAYKDGEQKGKEYNLDSLCARLGIPTPQHRGW